MQCHLNNSVIFHKEIIVNCLIMFMNLSSLRGFVNISKS